MNIPRNSAKARQDEALKRAQESADSGNGLEMLNCLIESMLLEAYERSFKNKYPLIDKEDIHDIVGEATDDVYGRVNSGRKVHSIPSYLWKIIERRLSDLAIKEKQLLKGTMVDRLGRHDNQNETDIDGRLEKGREYAISLAEKLVPRLGLVNVQQVMTYLLGAIRNGAEDISSTEIAEALDMSPANVRQATKRGFERLAKIVREENLVDEKYDFPFLGEMNFLLDDESEEPNSEENEQFEN